MQILIVFLTVFFINTLDNLSKILISKTTFFFLIFVVIFLFFQYFFPSLLDFSYSYLVNRNYSFEELNSYTGGLNGIAPEPAYMASQIIGAWILISVLDSTLESKTIILAITGVLLTGSMSAFLMLLIFICIRYFNSYISLILILLFIPISIYLFAPYSLLDRSYSLASQLLSNPSPEGLRTIDSSFGSLRLVSIADYLSHVCCGQVFGGYSDFKGYSIFSKLFYEFSPFHFIALPLILKIKNRFHLISAFCFLFYGPVLNWMLFAGFLTVKKTELAK